MRVINTVVVIALCVLAESSDPKWFGYIISLLILAGYFYLVYIWPRAQRVSRNDYRMPALNVMSALASSESTQSESEFEALWNRWDDFLVDQAVQVRCQEAVQPLENLIFSLAGNCLRFKTMPDQLSRELGDSIGIALGHLARGSLMVGLEFPRHDVYHTYGKAYRLRGLASASVEKITTLLLAKLLEGGFISPIEAYRIASESNELIKVASVLCFKEGAKLSPRFERYKVAR